MSGAITKRPEADNTSGPVPPLFSGSITRTHALGKLLGALLQPGDMILLQGPLGAGKTALTQGIGAGMGVQAVINSPTFTILKEYTGRLPLYHFDLYRLDDPDEVYSLGFEDYFVGDGACVVEWAERGESEQTAGSPWPESYVRITFAAPQSGARNTRHLDVKGIGPRGVALANAWLRAAEEDA